MGQHQGGDTEQQRRRARDQQEALADVELAAAAAVEEKQVGHDQQQHQHESEPFEVAIEGADAVIIATNHSEFQNVLELIPDGVLLADPWNTTGSGQVFGTVREHAAVE